MVAKKRTIITLKTLKHLPWWTWVFIVACLAIPFSTLGGAIPTAIAALGIVLCVRVVILSDVNLPLKIALCTLTAVGAWGIAWLSVFLFS